MTGILEGRAKVVQMPGVGAISYSWVIMVLALGWFACLQAMGARSPHEIGHGAEEYRAVIKATIAAFALVLVLAFFLQIELTRTLFVLGAPIGLFVLLLSRWLSRQWLRRRQRAGQYVHRAVLIGEPTKVTHVASMITRSEGTGYRLVGAITKGGSSGLGVSGLDVIGDYSTAVDAIDDAGADTVIIAGADDLDPRSLQLLGWAMAERDVGWIVAPAMTDVAGPRIHAQPVAGLPLIHISFPALEGVRAVTKRTVDILGSAALIVALSPVLLVIALLVKLTSPGPVLYGQKRVGRNGNLFTMYKFRSMIQGADSQLAGLLAQQGTQDTPGFKVRDDPRITPVGKFLREHSLDELPQLFNVLLGTMSLVGPRPERPAEVALYDDIAHRRLLVKPGMSGLWQVSGRSSLSWEDKLRLDLYYVDNWSLTEDLVILFRTVRAVVKPDGTAN